MIWRLILGGAEQALGQLTSNRLRTLLSLLGITIGIFCIIAVRSAVSSLEDNIRSSFEKLGDDVLYITQMPWAENPHENYWKYLKRPSPDFQDLEVLQKKCDLMDVGAFSVFLGRKRVKYRSSHVGGAFMLGVTYDYAEILNVEIEKGRWMTNFEFQKGRNTVVLGSIVASELFGRIDPVGRVVKIAGQKFTVIGVIAPSGDDLINPVDFDRAVILGYHTAKKVANVKNSNMFGGASIMVKARDGVDVDDLKDEVTGILRSHHRLKPSRDNDFAVNELSILSSLLDNFFGVLNIAGLVIGMFAILVGMFSVANIMFVSVKERTNIIGIKMALGANRATILWEFLVESTVICLIGGVAGLLLVFAVLKVLSVTIDFTMYMSFENSLYGILLSVIIGVLSGVLPALQASRMDPVEAMRR
jgi:putative ABC transport system permease protein